MTTLEQIRFDLQERICMHELSPEEAQAEYELAVQQEWEAEHWEPDSLVSVYGHGWFL